MNISASYRISTTPNQRVLENANKVQLLLYFLLLLFHCREYEHNVFHGLSGQVYFSCLYASIPADDVRTTAGSVAPLVPAREETVVGTVDQEQKQRTTSAAQEVDLSNPDKYCKLCTASFNNPHMAQQHYSGRKHQRNQARQEMISKLPKDSERGNYCTNYCFHVMTYAW